MRANVGIKRSYLTRVFAVFEDIAIALGCATKIFRYRRGRRIGTLF
jgi:hypothetical protein